MAADASDDEVVIFSFKTKATPEIREFFEDLVAALCQEEKGISDKALAAAIEDLTEL